MAISYSNFLTQVRNYTEVDSNVLSDTILDQFIRNTELDIAGKLLRITTYLAVNQEQLLLYGVLVEAYGFLKGPQDLYTQYKARYDESTQAFAIQQMGRRRRAEYDDGVPRVKVASPSP
jgi:hypothetical protein